MIATAHYAIRSKSERVCIVDWHTTPKDIPHVIMRRGSVFFRSRQAILSWKRGKTVWDVRSGYAPPEIIRGIREDFLAS